MTCPLVFPQVKSIWNCFWKELQLKRTWAWLQYKSWCVYPRQFLLTVPRMNLPNLSQILDSPRAHGSPLWIQSSCITVSSLAPGHFLPSFDKSNVRLFPIYNVWLQVWQEARTYGWYGRPLCEIPGQLFAALSKLSLTPDSPPFLRKPLTGTPVCTSNTRDFL